MEVTQFTYFQQVGGIECEPVSGELTYGLERLAMYIQGVENVYDLDFNGRDGVHDLRRRVPARRARISRHNFEFADTEMLFRHFADAEAECQALGDRATPSAIWRCRPMTSASRRATVQSAGCARRDLRDRAPAYIGRVRALAKACCEAWLKTEGGGCLKPPPAFPVALKGLWPNCCSNCSPRKSPRRMQAAAAEDLRAGRSTV